MESWKQQLRARLAKHIAGLRHLDAARQAALLEAEFTAAVEATESGRPFGALGAEQDSPADTATDESPEDIPSDT